MWRDYDWFRMGGICMHMGFLIGTECELWKIILKENLDPPLALRENIMHAFIYIPLPITAYASIFQFFPSLFDIQCVVTLFS